MSVARIEDREVTPRFLDDDDVRQLEALFAEVKRLRGIEAALNNDILESGPILYFRRLAKQATAKGRDGDAYYLNAIADELEAK